MGRGNIALRRMEAEEKARFPTECLASYTGDPRRHRDCPVLGAPLALPCTQVSPPQALEAERNLMCFLDAYEHKAKLDT